VAHPEATLAEVTAASRAERQDVYQWLFRSRSKQKQDTRILSLLESDAFAQIHRSWKRLGFPFDSLVPSYATALGSSGDRPAALAELVGILLNDGVRHRSIKVEGLHFAADSPYETVLKARTDTAERVMPAAVAAAVRQAMTRVVTEGTARRLHGALGAPGLPIEVGGKTGTGDNRLDSHGPWHRSCGRCGSSPAPPAAVRRRGRRTRRHWCSPAARRGPRAELLQRRVSSAPRITPKASAAAPDITVRVGASLTVPKRSRPSRPTLGALIAWPSLSTA